MQGFELAAISVPPSDFHNFFEVATGHRRNAGNRAGGNFLSSLFSLLSSLLRHRSFPLRIFLLLSSLLSSPLSLLSSLFSLLSSFFSLLSSLFSLLLVVVVW